MVEIGDYLYGLDVEEVGAAVAAASDDCEATEEDDDDAWDEGCYGGSDDYEDLRIDSCEDGDVNTNNRVSFSSYCDVFYCEDCDCGDGIGGGGGFARMSQHCCFPQAIDRHLTIAAIVNTTRALMMKGRHSRLVPCTSLGCLELLRRSGIAVRGKQVRERTASMNFALQFLALS